MGINTDHAFSPTAALSNKKMLAVMLCFTFSTRYDGILKYV